ncbi:ATP-binding protein, partial [Thermodesulfobacteriota bacterium]
INQADSDNSPEDLANHSKPAETVRQALLARRRFSLRLQIYLGLLLVFILAVCIATVLMITMYQVEDKLEFLEIMNDYVIEIQQARRFEKNFFLYGTNLSDALENIYQAKDIFNRNAEELKKILSKDNHRINLTNLNEYEDLLKLLAQIDQKEGEKPLYSKSKKEIELDLRKHGQKMISFAQDLTNKLKVSVSQALLRSRNIHVYFLIFLIIFIVFNGYYLGSNILVSINRFAAYAQRIALGDFTLITPKRRFRDEFTDLAIAFNHMIQELEHREAVLIQSHKMRAVGTLTAGVAHELNNPLNNIMLSAHMLLEDYSNLSEDERFEIIKDVVSETNRSRNIISNLLDFVRESSSQIEPLELVQLLKDTITLASNQIKLSGIKVEFQTTGNLPSVHGDGQQLRQVFLNLILNAIDVSEKNSKIQILVLPADEPDYVAVKVIDFGSGIPKHILGSIFDPFFTTKGKGKGTGLGLSVSQGIITKHGGRILVSSLKNKGSIFTVTLPVTTIPSEILSEKKF